MTPKYITNVVFLALTATWVGLVLACAWIPAYPVLGSGVVITFSSIVFSALTAPILGPLWGGVSGFIFGWLVPSVNPGASIGLLTFLTPTMAALMSGLVLFNRWKEATLIFCLEMVICFLHPFAWYQAMPIITWQYWLVLAFIVIPPVRKWIVGSITSRNPANLTIALWCLAWIALVGGDTATGNNIFVWTLGWGPSTFYPLWVGSTIYYAIADALNCLAGATIGTAVLLALRRANLRVLAVDFLKTEK
ncbi:MAG: hypothetical protein WCD81_11975 [Candidatus Bathyarchaeia archaeon]